MELFFRKYFWTAHLLFLLMLAYLAARTVNIFVESAIAPTSSAEAPKSGARATPAEAVAQLNLERVANLLGLPLPKEPDHVEIKEPSDDLNSAPVRTSLRVKLLGTLLATRPEWSIASILDTSSQRAQTYMVGDKILGAEVLEIERQRVIIFNTHRREFIDNEAGDGAIVASVPPPHHGSDGPTPSALGNGIRALSENEYEVPRSEIDKTLSNLNDVAMQARIVPAFKDGQAQGFKLFSIRPDSIYSKIGIQNGDVIKKINGFALDSPEKALEIYTKLKEANRIDIVVERNGRESTKTYNVH